MPTRRTDQSRGGKGKGKGKSRASYPRGRQETVARTILVQEHHQEPFTLVKARKLRGELDDLRIKYTALYVQYGANIPEYFKYFDDEHWEELKETRDEIDRVQRLLGKRKKEYPAFGRVQGENRARFVELTEKAQELIKEYKELKASVEIVTFLREQNKGEASEDTDEDSDD
ncbi:hypothetical protein B7494_g4001 [Chlorociboria aeruginascens]|nr:hypothetical protein B7494_g4001 [Chlorociboria aeruginascens]